MSRPYTEEEIRKMFIDHIWTMINYWDKESRRSITKEKLSGLAHSILVMLDGGSWMPGFKIIPHPHKDDKQYHIDNGENWFPDDVNIGGGLHEILYKREI